MQGCNERFSIRRKRLQAALVWQLDFDFWFRAVSPWSLSSKAEPIKLLIVFLVASQLSSCATTNLMSCGPNSCSEASTAAAGEKNKFEHPIWNVWTEEPYVDEITFQQAQARPHGDYTLAVNLSAMAYEKAGSGIWSQRVSNGLSRWLDKYKDATSADVQLIVEPDPRFFFPIDPSERGKHMEIRLDKIRWASNHGVKIADHPLDDLRKSHGNNDFLFGKQSFHLRTRDQIGTGYVSISVWINGRPIDEIAAAICVRNTATDQCDEKVANVQSLRGVDLSKDSMVPDAAFHLLNAGNETVAIFRCESCRSDGKDYLAWRREQIGSLSN